MIMKKIFVRSAYNYDMDAVSLEDGVDCSRGVDEATGEIRVLRSRTQQSFADECDINVIVRRFGLTGEMPTGMRLPAYSDYEGVFDFHTAMTAIRTATEDFMSMPADVRARFHNDPSEFLSFCSNDSNQEEAVKLGLAMPKAAALAAAAPPPSAAVAPVGGAAPPAPPAASGGSVGAPGPNP
ncbi:internal scaffolding protein [robinz microvirus RP_96]|nr:internal scaffolding protein [robinz microvirus RP_96]